jgi:hypothetical protein
VRGLPDAEHVIEPGQVSVGSVAPELGEELHLLDLGPEAPRPSEDLVPGADVLEGHPLVLVEEEDGDVGGVDELLDLVVAQVLVEPRLLVQPVRLVDDEGPEGAGSAVVNAPIPGRGSSTASWTSCR